MSEVCQIHKLNKRLNTRFKQCSSADIHLYITDNRIPVCTKHWNKIADLDWFK